METSNRQEGESADSMTYEDFIARAVHLGAEGDLSPNVRLLIPLRDIAKTFDHTHGTITENDACILLANAKLGMKRDGKTAMENFLSVVGCHNDLCCLLQQLFADHPELTTPFEVAIILSHQNTAVFDDRELDTLMAIHRQMRRR